MEPMVPFVHAMNTSDLKHDIRTLEVLQQQPALSQRELAVLLGVSLGKANYCLRKLLAKGLLKAQNFKNSKNKLAYAYVLTPAGVAARAELTAEFLRVKVMEYERLSDEIDQIKVSQLAQQAYLDQPVVGHLP
jgi:EPS-associated MarR family transcriptional regulator